MPPLTLTLTHIFDICRIVSVGEYVAACAHVTEEVGLEQIFVSTEDLGVLRALEDAHLGKSVRLLYDPAEARNSIENSRLLSVSVLDMSVVLEDKTFDSELSFALGECP